MSPAGDYQNIIPPAFLMLIGEAKLAKFQTGALTLKVGQLPLVELDTI